MIIFVLGYFIMLLIFLIWRLIYHVFNKKESQNPICALKIDFLRLFECAKQLFLSNKKIFRVVIVIAIILGGVFILLVENFSTYIFEEILSSIMFFLLAIVFLPQDNPIKKGFPTEILGFVYSVVFMFYSAGSLVFHAFFVLDLKENMWIFGDTVTLISYIVCIATLRRFMERFLSTIEITLLGMIMMTTLEFITYYGIGFFNGVNWNNSASLDWFKTQDFNSNVFGDVTFIINQGIYLASQSQILERTPVEIWAYIILNGTDVLTVTVVLGYILQKFFTNSAR